MFTLFHKPVGSVVGNSYRHFVFNGLSVYTTALDVPTFVEYFLLTATVTENPGQYKNHDQ